MISYFGSGYNISVFCRNYSDQVISPVVNYIKIDEEYFFCECRDPDEPQYSIQPKSVRYLSYYSKFESANPYCSNSKVREKLFLKNIKETGSCSVHIDIPSLHFTNRFQAPYEFFQTNSKW